jgi:hypothetical protein
MQKPGSDAGVFVKALRDFLANSAADHCSRCDAGPD